jgi:methionine biosynthesis protein MetW
MKKVVSYSGGTDYASTPGSAETLGLRLVKVIKVFSGYKCSRILDVGCGDGNFALLLKEAAGASEVCGIEISEKGVELANKAGVRAVRLNIDEESFPFDDGYFDAVFAGEVIEHLYDPDHMLEEIYRVMQPDGLLVMTVPNLASWFNRLALLLGFQPYGTNPSTRHSVGHLKNFNSTGHMVTSDHIRVFTLGSLKQLLRLHRFSITKVSGIHEGVPHEILFSAALNIIDRVISIVPALSYRTIVVCRKG